MANGKEKSSNADREIFSSRLFNAPRQLVFDAFANPEHLKHWWGPNGFTNTFHEFDFRTGGTWRFTMHGPDGADYINEVVFDEVVAPERIVYRHISNPKFTMTITLVSEGDKTRMNWHMLFENVTVFNNVKSIAVPGNEQNFDKLEAQLSKMLQ